MYGIILYFPLFNLIIQLFFLLTSFVQVLKPGGLLLIRDYGLYDQAMLRFGPGHKLGDNFYVRQDGTRAYYFSEGMYGISKKYQNFSFSRIKKNK